LNIGQWFIEGGTLLQVIFPKNQGIQIAANLLIQVGSALEAGTGTVGPIRAGNDGITITVAPWKS
jgi:hypothetical protein